MSDENPVQEIKARAAELFPDDADERDDYVLGRMQRLGFKKGPGEWIREEDDDSPRDDDDEPVTRADIRRMEREKAKRSANTSTDVTPPKKLVKEKTAKKADPWWD